MLIINKELLDSVTNEAKENERLRKNFNIHKNLDDNVQRLLNALEPNTVIPIHRHKNTDETYVLLRGALIVSLLDDNKNIIQSVELSLAKGNLGINIPAGQWHSVEVLESGTVILEVKEGPYQPIGKDDVL